MTRSCAYAGINELGVGQTYINFVTRPLETVAKWLNQDERIFENILAIINEIKPELLQEQIIVPSNPTDTNLPIGDTDIILLQ